MDGFVALYIFVLAAFTGYEIIGRVPVILHTPLMSGSNFVHGIVMIGAMVVLGHAVTTLEKVIGFLAVLMVALLFGMVGQTSSLRDLAQRGATAFTWLSFVQVTLICVLTPLFMAGAIAQESNPRTWEILLTTPLNRVQIVVGNLMGRQGGVRDGKGGGALGT